jgi:glycosyltransferase involved in cell wall biosynthesis
VRVLLAHSFYRLPGGEDRYVREQHELLARKHDVALLSRSNADVPGGVAAAARMTLSPPEEARVRAEVERFGPDVIHLHNPYPALGPSVHRVAAALGVPLVMTVHNFRLRCPNGYMFTEGRRCRRCEKGAYFNAVLHSCFQSRAQAAGYAASLWVHRFVLRLERAVALFIAPSEFVRARLLDWAIPSDRAVVVRHPTALSATATAEPGSYGLYLGRLSSEKGIDLLLHALARAGDPPFKIVGGGPIADDLRASARALGLRRTEFTGHVESSAVPPLLAGARFVALPSRWEEVAGLSALEAMAAGRPLVVADSGGLPELVAGGAGVAYEPSDVDALARHMARFIEDDAACRAAGERGLAFVGAEFSPERHLERLEAAYARVLGRAHA